ncbi:TBCC1 protein, partial [Polyodon spathula]|nr:TBCC domain-containing protein 1 [Polyodon spathula]XP_041118983.1 TBCC domain-containing protein 1 [Polyodon spathula]XP_041118984.1 TBCC domain-containing protein 1 [Polyodon spathula]MBN3277336.1 TBCC1 protein [Polyodon spathula]
MELHNVRVWVRMEPFLVGALQAPPPAKFSMHYLRKMATYVRTRAKDGCFPHLCWPMWRHIACGKLQLPDELAWVYFETFDLLVERSPEERLEWAEAVSQCSTHEELNRLRQKLSVDTLQFLLFLYTQQLNRVSLRTSVIGEEWPSPRARSPSPDHECKTSLQNKNCDDQAHLAFVQTHLSDLLELVLDPEQLSSSGHCAHDSLLSPEALRGLSFLLEGSVSKARAVHPLHELLSWAPLQTQAGYSKLSQAFSLQRLQAWLKDTLTLNPFGYTTCLKTGKKLAWAQQVEGTMKRAKIARNTHNAPAGSKMVLMSQVYKQTLAKDSEKLSGANVKLHRCNESFIYLLSPLRSVSVEKCRNTTLVLGPVQTSVHVQSCENVKVVCVAGRLSVCASSYCTFHMLTPTRPLLLSGNVALTLAPYHTNYPSLEDHMASVGLAVVPNLWDQPVCLGSEGIETPSPAPYGLLPPGEFNVLVVPFEMDGDTSEIPGGLPPLYQAAISHREQKVQAWQRTVKEARLNKEQRKQFQVLVEQKFHEWLLETGHRQQLDSLIPAPTDSKQAAG